MKVLLYYVVLLCIFCLNVASSQQDTSVSIVFQPKYGNLALADSVWYRLNGGDSVQIETLKFYISGIQFLYSDSVVWREANSYHLIDYADKKSLRVLCAMPSNVRYTAITMNLGIDSTTNVGGVFGGDLDPTRGMYWTWQSGYINFKVEGKSNRCATRNREFQFHIGGYQYPYNSLQSIELNVVQDKQIKIVMEIDKLFAAIDIVQHNHIMSPSMKAVTFSRKAAEIFRILPP